MTGQIIILHGPSSSGKSTLAASLQNVIELPFWHISIDHLRDAGVLPTKRIESGEFAWSDMRKPFFEGFHTSLAAYAHAGNNLIVEHILDDPTWVVSLKSLLQPFDVYFVGLHCDLETLKQREAARGNRPIGSAAQDYHTVHVGRIYDIEVGNETSTKQAVSIILKGWRSGIRRSEFATAAKS